MKRNRWALEAFASGFIESLTWGLIATALLLLVGALWLAGLVLLFW